MYHSITFDNKNTWDDWHLIPSSRPMFVPPEPNIRFVEIPGGKGIDLSESDDWAVTFKNRNGNFDFIVANDYWEWTEAYNTIRSFLNGTNRYAVLEDEPDYRYFGKFILNQWKSDKNYSTISIDYSVSPFKIEAIGDDSKWLWDTFDFRQGVISDYKNLQVTSSITVILTGLYANITPTFKATSPMVVIYSGKNYSIPAGVSRPTGLKLGNGQNTLTIQGNGYISIGSEGGIL